MTHDTFASSTCKQLVPNSGFSIGILYKDGHKQAMQVRHEALGLFWFFFFAVNFYIIAHLPRRTTKKII